MVMPMPRRINSDYSGGECIQWTVCQLACPTRCLLGLLPQEIPENWREDWVEDNCRVQEVWSDLHAVPV
jgi:formate hydrogenlyase subunit 6/NADH:ubiquinone oxidoreductase subunit I